MDTLVEYTGNPNRGYARPSKTSDEDLEARAIAQAKAITAAYRKGFEAGVESAQRGLAGKVKEGA